MYLKSAMYNVTSIDYPPFGRDIKVIVKLSQKPKLKLQLLDEIAILSFNPTTPHPRGHYPPDKYEG